MGAYGVAARPLRESPLTAIHWTYRALVIAVLVAGVMLVYERRYGMPAAWPLQATLLLSIALQSQHRHFVALNGPDFAWGRATMYCFALAFVVCWFCDVLHPRRLCAEHYVVSLFASLPFACLSADALLLGIVSRLRSRQRLAPWSPFRFRYSLQASLLFVLAVGTYASVMFLLYRGPVIEDDLYWLLNFLSFKPFPVIY
jgi:hypothetical protein